MTRGGAWYVWASLGLYPLTPGLPVYVVTTPSFDEVEIRPSTGRPIRIERKNGGGDGRETVKWNDLDLVETRLSHAQIREGGRLGFRPSLRP